MTKLITDRDTYDGWIRTGYDIVGWCRDHGVDRIVITEIPADVVNVSFEVEREPRHDVINAQRGHYPSCHCPAKHGEDCPLTIEECSARTDSPVATR